MSRDQDSVAVIVAEMRAEIFDSWTVSDMRVAIWADRLAALTREAAPQASGGDDEVEELFRRLTRDDSTPDEIESRMKLRAIIRRLATTDSAIQSQQGATGGAVAWIWEERTYSGHWEVKTGLSVPEYHEAEKWVRNARPLVYGCLAHPQGESVCTCPCPVHAFSAADIPQAAGSAPGEAMQPQRSHGSMTTPEWIRNGPQPTNSAGSVASGAVSGEFPAPIRNPEAWPERYADGFNDALQLVIDCGFATRPATAAGSAPVGVEGLWTDKQCVEFLSVAFRHCYIDGTFKLDDIRMGQRRANELAATPAVSVGDDTARLDYIERTFSGMTNRERYLPVQMVWGAGANGRTLREACDKYMKRDAALEKERAE